MTVSSAHRPCLFIVTSNGRKPSEVSNALEQKGFRVSDPAKQAMSKPQFVTTNGVTYTIGLIFADEFSDDERITANIRNEANRRGWVTPPMEVSYLAREKILDEMLEKLGLLRLVIMHDPVDARGEPFLLGIHCYDEGQWLDVCYGYSNDRWGRRRAFGFLVSQTGV